MENKIDVKIIVQNAANLLEESKIANLPKDTFTKYIYEYPIPKQLSYNQKIIQKKLKLIYWAVASIHIELGNMLIAIQSYNKFKQLQDKNNEEYTELSYMLFLHHYFLTIECIYRAWERVSRVLSFIHTKESKRNCYFHKTVQMLKDSKAYPEALLNELESHLSHWEMIKKDRNKYSTSTAA